MPSQSYSKSVKENVYKPLKWLSSISGIVVIAAAGAQAFGQASPGITFGDFIDNVNVVDQRELFNRADSRVESTTELKKMLGAIAERYKRVDTREVTHSFQIGNQIYDCISINRQPAAARYHIETIAEPPPFRYTPGSGEQVAGEGTLEGGSFDTYGNSRSCPSGTVPIERLTIEAMIHAKNLSEVFVPYGQMSKKETLEALARGKANEAPRELAGEAIDENAVNPPMSINPPKPVNPPNPINPSKPISPPRVTNPSAKDTLNEKEVGMVATIPNVGGVAVMNIWKPTVSASSGETLSAMEEIFTGGTGTNGDVELVEAGWAVEPDVYGDTNPHLFIFETADDFRDGCVDDLCGDFIQVSGTGTIGEILSSSTKNGKQQEIEVEWQLFEGNWWLLVDSVAIGYYPGSIFAGRELAQKADKLVLDVAGYGSTSMPQIGSGTLPNGSTPNIAAYHRGILVFPSPQSINPKMPSLTPLSKSLASHFTPPTFCANVSGPFEGPFSSSAPEVFFYEGGPGGQQCIK